MSSTGPVMQRRITVRHDKGEEGKPEGKFEVGGHRGVRVLNIKRVGSAG